MSTCRSPTGPSQRGTRRSRLRVSGHRAPRSPPPAPGRPWRRVRASTYPTSMCQKNAVGFFQRRIIGNHHPLTDRQAAENLELLDAAAAHLDVAALRRFAVTRDHKYPVATGALQEWPHGDDARGAVVSQLQAPLSRFAGNELARRGAIEIKIHPEATVAHLRIDALDGDIHGPAMQLNVGDLAHAHAGQIKLIDVRGQLHSAGRRHLGQTLPRILVLAHLQVDGSHTTTDGRTYDQSIERSMNHIEVVAQDGKLPVDVGKQPVAKICLALVTVCLNRHQVLVVGQLVGDDIPLFRRFQAAGYQVVATGTRALQADQSVLHLRQCPLIRQLVLLEGYLILLQLRYRLVQLRLLLNHRQREVGITELDNGLALLNRVTWLNQHAVDAAAIHRIDIKRFARNYAGAQRDQIVKNALLDRCNGGKSCGHAQCLYARIDEDLDGNENRAGHPDNGQRDPAAQREPARRNLSIHP